MESKQLLISTTLFDLLDDFESLHPINKIIIPRIKNDILLFIIIQI